MNKFYCIAFFLFMCFSGFAFASLNTIECQVRENQCMPNSGEKPVLFVSKDFYDLNGYTLSSNVAIAQDENYNRILCCKSPYGSIDVEFKEVSKSCSAGADALMYFTSSMSGRVGFKDYDSNETFPYNESFYTHKLCIKKPEEFSEFDIVLSDRDYSFAGYSCLYKTSSGINGFVSDCNATFNHHDRYVYTVWGRLFQSTSSLKCAYSCTSKLDGRVYVACGTQINACRNVPESCNGAILGSWIDYDSDGDGIFESKVQCAPPWNVVKGSDISDILKVDASSDECLSLISKDYPVLYGNEMVNMKVYICAR